MGRTHACQYIHCSKEFESAKDLKMCSRCKRARYCSENCQRADWKGHKDSCKLQQSANQQSEELSKLGVKTREGLDPLKLSTDLKKWSARHKDWQTTVKSQALKIWRDDSQWRSLGVLVQLKPHNIAPDSKDTSYLFTFNSVTAIPFPMIMEIVRRQGAEFENLTMAIKEQEGYLKTGVGGRKAAKYMIMVIAASNAWIVAPEIVLERELKDVPKEDPMWLERARQSLQFPFDMDLGKAMMQIRNEWAPKQEKALTFIALNCLKLKENPTRGRTHLVEIDTIITNSPKGGYNITPLDAEAKPFAAYYARCANEGLTAQDFKEELEDAEKRCQKPETFKGFPGNRVMVAIMIGMVPTLIPVFVADVAAATLETRVDWQEHKYRLLVR